MIDRQTIEYLRLMHGSYNFIMMLLFFYQASLGIRIRSNRKRKTINPTVIKRHRKLGPKLAVMGVTGFFAGLIIIYFDYGQLFKYPLHLITGSAIASLIISTYLISNKIKSPESPWRTPHSRIGISIISLYAFQTFLGVGILF